MPATITNLWTDEVVDISTYIPGPVSGVPFDLLTSDPIPNSSNHNSLKVSANFSAVLPANVLGSFHLQVEIDFQDANNNWRLLPVYQGNSLRKSDQAPERILIMQPNIVSLSLGETDIVVIGNRKVCEINRGLGQLPDSPSRVRVSIVEGTPGGLVALQSFKFTCEVEQYTV